MFTNRFTKLVVVLLVLVVAVVTASFVTRSANIPTPNRSYDAVEQIRAGRSVIGASNSAREYQLGERYGEISQDLAKEKAAREYWLGERYGQTPKTDHSYDQIENLRINRIVGFNADLSYDQVEQVRVKRPAKAIQADRSYDTIENLRVQRTN